MNSGHSYGKQPKPGQLFCSDVGKQEPWMTPARFSALFAVAVLNTLVILKSLILKNDIIYTLIKKLYKRKIYGSKF